MGDLVPAPRMLGPCRRLDGWEDRMAAVLQAARGWPCRVGETDCFRLACAIVEALTGQDLWTPWAGRYSTPREVLKRIVEFGGDPTAAASKLFGSPPAPMPLGRRGDVCEFFGQPHLGVVIGVNVVTIGPEGFMAVPRELGRHCWRIG